MREKGITRISSNDLHKIEDLTDWKRVDAMTEEDIQRAAASDPDAPMTTEADWKNARMVWPDGRERIFIAIDKDIVRWFGDRGLDCGAQINAVLREYIEEQQRPRKRPSRSSVVEAKKHTRKPPKRAAVKS